VAYKEKLSIFLSHAGEDHLVATDLARKIKTSLFKHGYNVEVFNTSEPEHRFKDIRDVLLPGDLWEPKIKRYDVELTDYLQQHLKGSFAYLLLVTRESLMKNSKWIEMEMSVAKEEAERQELYFIPCVTEVTELYEIPEKAMTFQGINVSSDEGINQLTGVLKHAIQNQKRDRMAY
jgi:hypothetical protein